MTIDFTFVIVGHNEEETVSAVLDQAQEAASAKDSVVFLDSGSTDSTAAIASEKAWVWSAPKGKGAAMQYAFDLATTEWLIFVDADLSAHTKNIPLTLAEEVRESIKSNPHLSLLIGEFPRDDDDCPQSVTRGVFEPLIKTMLPASAELFGHSPLSGQRAVKKNLLGKQTLPKDFGVEAYLNFLAAQRGSETIATVSVGEFQNPFRYKPYMSRQVSEALLRAAREAAIIGSSDNQTISRKVEEISATIAEWKGGTGAFGSQVRRGETNSYLKKLDLLAGELENSFTPFLWSGPRCERCRKLGFYEWPYSPQTFICHQECEQLVSDKRWWVG